MRGHRALGGFAVCVAACNGLTGVDALGIDDGEAAVVADGAVAQPPPAADASGSTPDSGFTPIRDAGVLDAIVDAGVMDVGVDSPPVCTVATANAGPRYGTSANGLGWSSAEGILAPNDNKYAHTNSTISPMTVLGFGFNLPSSAQIKGIKVEFARTAAGPVADDAIALPKGASKKNGPWPQGPIDGPYQTTTYGGAGDTWGASWTAAEINAPTFGVSVTPTGAGDGHADSLGVTVYYCP